MKRFSLVTAIAFLAAIAISPAANAACSANTPLSVWGQNGSNGLVASTGQPNTYDAGSVVGQITNDLTNLDGTANLHGSADCSDDLAALRSSLSRELQDAQSNLAALSAASSQPVWLEPGENFAVSGGLGFADGATALGATGIVRFDKHWSGFAGAAVSTDDTDVWSGKAGLRVGW
jgi:hypothetical protein